MTRPVRPLFVLSILCLALALWAPGCRAWAADATPLPWEQGAFAGEPDAILRAATRPEDSGTEVVVLLDETRITYDESGRETATSHMVYRIVSPAAHESWKTLNKGWSPWHQERPQLRARVITPDGAVHLLDPSTIAENGEAAAAEYMFEDGRVLRAPLPAAGPGAIVEQEITVRDTLPFFAAGNVRLHQTGLQVPVRHARLILEAPAGLPLRWAVRGLPGDAPREEVRNGMRRVVFEYRDLAGFELPEPGLPPEEAPFPHIAFSTGASWQEVAGRYAEIVDKAIQGSDVSSFLRAAGAPAASRAETIERLVTRLGEEIRYTGLELGEGGIIPRSPAETLRRKFGDCKDKAVLLTALLREVGIPAHVALLRAGEGMPEVEETLPGLGTFNHAIVLVPGEPALWVDPTDRFARAGELPTADQAKLALVASPATTALVRTPESIATDNWEQETREFFLSDLGPGRVVETTEYKGEIERRMRSFYQGVDPEELRKGAMSYVESAYLAKDLDRFDSSPATDLARPLTVHIEASKVGRGYTGMMDAAVAVDLASLMNRLPDDITGDVDDEEKDEEKPRRVDYVFDYPFGIETVYQVVPAAGFAPQKLPEARSRRFGPAVLTEEYTADVQGTVTARLRFAMEKRRITPQELAALRAGVREVREDSVVLLLFEQVGESHLKAGRVPEALGEFRRLAALAPHRALPRTRIAHALLAGGLGEAARDEAKRAVEVEPQLAQAHRTLGWVLQHDLLGRRFASGFDRAAALAAYRKAKELDPDDETLRLDLAILLEHDARGERYSPDADLTAAIAEYQAMKTDLDSTDADANLPVALLRAGRYKELQELLGRLGGSPQQQTLGLVATALLEGPDAAAQKAARTFQDRQASAAALATAGQSLFVLRHYSEAAALFERASRSSDNAASLLSLVEVLRRTRRFEEVTATLRSDRPENTAKRLLFVSLSSAAGAGDTRALLSLFARDVAGRSEGLNMERLGQLIGSMARGRLKQEGAGDIPVPVLTDLALAAVRETVSGSDETGYRVALRAEIGQQKKDQVLYVIPEDGEYRIAAFDEIPGTIGAEALRRVQRGDLRGARQWLDWAHEALGSSGAGDDPLASPALLSLWARNTEAPLEVCRCAAAALSAPQRETAAEVLPILASCLETEGDLSRRNALEMARVWALGALERTEDQLAAVRRLQEGSPRSATAFGLELTVLEKLERWDEMRAAGERRLAQMPGDAMALRALYGAALGRGELEAADAALRRVIDSGKAQSQDFNNLAWLSLARGKADDQAVEHAQRAATLQDYKSSASLHTLASLYAARGKTSEAYQIILQAIDANLDAAPDSEDWYVFGLLAEQYGLPEEARRCYERVTAPAQGRRDATSTYTLARSRLAALPAKRGAAR